MNDLATEELGVIRLASPCSVSWSSMKGDDTVRFCDQCQLNVYDVTRLTSFEVRDLVMKREGRTCMRFFKRFDGTLLTRDCPRGLALLGYLWNREKKKRTIGHPTGPLVLAGLMFMVLSLWVITLFGDNIRRLYGMSAGGLVGDPMDGPSRTRASIDGDPRAAVLTRFNASPPCPTSGAPVR
jgi:hypothetical protein